MTMTTKNVKTEKSIWSDLPRRLTTICIGFPLVWAILSNPTSALIFFIGVHGIVTWEYTSLETHKKLQQQQQRSAITSTKDEEKTSTIHPSSSILMMLGFIIPSMLLAHVPKDNDGLFHLLLCCTTGVYVWLQRQHWILGLLVITIPFRTWYIISQDFASTISILLVVWNCDTGALLFGRLSKKVSILPKIPVPEWIHQISPAKSMEGFIGGLLGGTWTAVSWIPRIMDWFHVDTSINSGFDLLWQSSFSNRLLLGISLSILAIVGDLVESSIKRQSSSKDSGSILPGHGGILDRFDSSLLAVLLYSVVLDWMSDDRK